MSGLDGLGWPTDPEPQPLPSRRYTCQVCGRKGRRSNSISERNRPPICPACTRNRSALCALHGIVRTYSRPLIEDEFRYGVGEGSRIDRVPVAVKVQNQTTVLDQLQDSNGCLRSDGMGLGVKFATFLIATNVRFRGIITLFSTSYFLKRYIYSR